MGGWWRLCGPASRTGSRRWKVALRSRKPPSSCSRCHREARIRNNGRDPCVREYGSSSSRPGSPPGGWGPAWYRRPGGPSRNRTGPVSPVDILPHGEQDVPALVGLDPPDHAHQVTGQVTDLVQAQVPAEFRHIVRTPALIGTRSVENDHDVARNLSPHGGEGPTQTPLLIVTLEKHHVRD